MKIHRQKKNRTKLFLLSLLSLATIQSKAIDFKSDIAGHWYPSDKDKLSEDIAKIANFPSQKTNENIRALILPHAGYIYSGKTAAKAIKNLSRQYKTVIIIGASHRHSLKDIIGVPIISSYSTPLGKYYFNLEKAKKLISSSEIFKDIPEVLKKEHSVQIKVPFLQALLEQNHPPQIIFLITGQLSYEKMKIAGEKIREIWDEDTLLVVSSDFTHYGERFAYTPFKNNISENIKNLDMKAFSFIENNNPDGFNKFISDTEATICGATPIAITLHAIKNDMKAKLIDYSNSSEVTGDNSDRVSYISAIIIDNKKKTERDFMLTKDEKKNLIALAKKTIEFYLKNKRIPSTDELNFNITENLKIKKATFVTLTINGKLRGCIGEILAVHPLYKSVIKNAINASMHDPRFRPLSIDEFSSIHVEISILSEPKEIASYKDIVIGRDGIILSKNSNSALFLPQVAPEQGWTLEETLSHLAMKAGLHPNEWKGEACSFKTFQADVFGEDEE